MAYTGKQRSLTITVNKTLAGVQVQGYPVTYYGRSAFSFNGNDYQTIDALKMTTMPVAEYQARLVDFKAYVEIGRAHV